MNRTKKLGLFIVIMAMIATMINGVSGMLFASDGDVVMTLANTAKDTTKIGDTITYTATIKNNTVKDIENAQMSFVMPEGLSLKRDTVMVNDQKAKEVSCDSEKKLWTVKFGEAKDIEVQNATVNDTATQTDAKEAAVETQSVHKEHVLSTEASYKITFSVDVTAEEGQLPFTMQFQGLKDGEAVTADKKDTVVIKKQEEKDAKKENVQDNLTKSASLTNDEKDAAIVEPIIDITYTSDPALDFMVFKKTFAQGPITVGKDVFRVKLGAGYSKIRISSSGSVVSGDSLTSRVQGTDTMIFSLKNLNQGTYSGYVAGTLRFKVTVGGAEREVFVSIGLTIPDDKIHDSDLSYVPKLSDAPLNQLKPGTIIGQVNSAKAGAAFTMGNDTVSQMFNVDASGTVSVKTALSQFGNCKFDVIGSLNGGTGTTSGNIKGTMSENMLSLKLKNDITTSNAKKAFQIGTISSVYSGISYAMNTDASSKNFVVDAKGNITLANDIIKAGEYPFTILASANGESAKISGKMVVAAPTNFNVSKIKADGSLTNTVGCSDFSDAYTKITTKDAYQIQFLKDYTLDQTEMDNMNKFLTDKTTRFVMTGLQADGKTHSTLSIGQSWIMGGNNSTEGNTVENLTFKYTGATAGYAIFANGNNTIIGDGVSSGVTVISRTKDVAIFGGAYSKSTEVKTASSHLVIKSGYWSRVHAGGVNNTITGDAYIEVTGTATGFGGVGGLTSFDNETTGSIQGTGTFVVGGNATSSIWPITRYDTGIAFDVMATNSYIGNNVKHVVVDIKDNANVTDLGQNIFNQGPSFKTKHGYILGDYDINISGNATVGKIDVGSNAPATVQTANGGAGDGDLNITINGCKSVGTIDPCIGTTSMKGKKHLTINTAKELNLANVKNVDDITVGKTGKSAVKMTNIIKGTITGVNTYPDINVMNGSTITYMKASNIGNIVSTDKENRFVINKATATNPITVSGTFTGDPIYLETSIGGAINDKLLTFAKEADAKDTDFLTNDDLCDIGKDAANIIFVDAVKNFNLAQVKADGTIVDIGGCKNFGAAYKIATTKDVYLIQFFKDYALDQAEMESMNKFLTDKTTHFVISGLQADGKTHSTLSISQSWVMGGNDSTEGNLIEDLKFNYTGSTAGYAIFANGNYTIIGDGVDSGVKSYSTSNDIAIFGGTYSKNTEVKTASTHLVIKSGYWSRIQAGGVNNTITGNAYVEVTGSAAGHGAGAGGLTSIDNETAGAIQGTSTVVVRGNAKCYIWPISIFDSSITYDIMPAKTFMGGNVQHLVVNVDGHANITAFGNNVFNQGPSFKTKHGYIFGDYDINIRGNATVGNINVGSNAPASVQKANGGAGDGDLNITIDGFKSLGAIDPTVSSTSMKGKKHLFINTPTEVNIASVKNVDDITVGKKGESATKLTSIVKASMTGVNTYPNLSIMNGSTVVMNAANTVQDITSTKADNTLQVPNGKPLTITGKVSGDVINLGETGTAAVGDILAKPATSAYATFKGTDAKLTLAEKKSDFVISYTDKNIVDGELTKVTQKTQDVIDAPTVAPVTKELSFTLKNSEDVDYNYGALKASDATHSDAYVSESEVSDSTWLKDGSVPNGASKVTITANGSDWTGALTGLSVDGSKCYYLHMRNEQGMHQVYDIDVHGVHATAKAGDQPYDDAQGMKFAYELKDTTLTSALTYTPSGISQVAFSLNGANTKALEDTFQPNTGTKDAFYGIQKFSGNAQEGYTMVIPNDLQKELQKGSKTVYLYVKDTLGNTSVSTVFVGDYLLNMDVTTQASVVAVNGTKQEVIAPVVKLYNFGAHQVNVQAGMRNYKDQAGKLKLVDDKTTYSSDELALHMIPVQNVTFTPINVKKVDTTLLNLGDLSVVNTKNTNHYKAFTFDGEFSKAIDKTLQENSFVLEYHITPDTH